MNAKTLLAAAVVIAALPNAAPMPASPGPLSHAKLTTRAVPPGGLAAAMHELEKGPGSRWIAWSAPIVDRSRQMCCFEGLGGWSDGTMRGSGRCRLSRRGENSMNSDRNADRVEALEDPADFLVFVRADRGTVQQVRSFSLDCAIDAEGAEVVWLDGVAADESVAWLETLVPRSARRESRSSPEDDDEDAGTDDADVSRAALVAIAMHRGAAAEAALARFVQADRPAAIRKKAAFWLGAARGRTGCQLLARVVPSDPDSAFRKSGTFALSLCADDAPVSAMIAMARRDPSPKVRSQALFWLAHRAGQKSAAAIQDAIRDDPDTEVKKQAVFALSQMPPEQGVPELIRVARTNRNPDVRERAVFWLGQSNDPRALDFIEEVLTR